MMPLAELYSRGRLNRPLGYCSAGRVQRVKGGGTPLVLPLTLCGLTAITRPEVRSPQPQGDSCICPLIISSLNCTMLLDMVCRLLSNVCVATSFYQRPASRVCFFAFFNLRNLLDIICKSVRIPHNRKQKTADTRKGICCFWQGMRDSNPRKRSQSPVCYRYTNPL